MPPPPADPRPAAPAGESDKKDDAFSSYDPSRAEEGEVVVHEKAVGSSDTLDDATYINVKGLSLAHVTALLFGECIPLAVLSVPNTFYHTGYVGGMLIVFLLGITNLYTSLVLWRYCLRHPDQLSIADIGARIFAFGRHGGYSRFGWWLGTFILLVNNVFIMGFHTLTGSEIINTLAYDPGKGWCTVAISVIIMAVCFVGTLPRRFGHIATMGAISAVSMSLCVLLTLIFVGIQHQHPTGKPPGEKVRLTATSPQGTTFVAANNAAINIVFIWVGQVAYPSFIAEMKDPQQFPKALYMLTAFEFLMFAGVGAFIYSFSGQFSSAPAVAVIRNQTLKKIAFSFALPPTILIGIIYASVASRSLFAAFMRNTYHYNHHTKLSWLVWTLINLVLWVIGWILGNAIPAFGDIVSLTSSLCDSSMGYVFWALAYIELYRGSLWANQGLLRRAETVFNIFLIPCGLYVLGPGVYTSVQAIINTYKSGHTDPFTCTPNNV